MDAVRAIELSSDYTGTPDRPIAGRDRTDLGTCEPVKVLRHHDIVRAGHDPSSCHFLETGFACSYKLLPDGRRQITTIHIPGDLIDFTKFVSRTYYAIAALTSCKVVAVAQGTLRAAMHRNAQLAEHLWHRELIAAATQREWLVSLGRRTALEGMAHLLCELLIRFQQVGLSNGYACRLPIRQAEFADMLGLSTVHVNRTVQHLRQTSMISWNGEALVIKDLERLIHLAEFDGSYLQVLPQGAYLTSLDLVMRDMKDPPQRLAAHNEGDSYGCLCEGRVARRDQGSEASRTAGTTARGQGDGRNREAWNLDTERKSAAPILAVHGPHAPSHSIGAHEI